MKRGLVVLSFSGYQEEALEEQKHKDEDETINLIEKQVVKRDPVAKHFIDLDDLDFILSEIKKDREGKMLKVEKMMMQGKIPVSSMLLLSSQSQVQLLCLLLPHQTL